MIPNHKLNLFVNLLKHQLSSHQCKPLLLSTNLHIKELYIVKADVLILSKCQMKIILKQCDLFLKELCKEYLVIVTIF